MPGYKYIPTPIRLQQHRDSKHPNENSRDIQHGSVSPTSRNESLSASSAAPTESPSWSRLDPSSLTTGNNATSLLNTTSSIGASTLTTKIIVGVVISTVLIVLLVPSITVPLVLLRKSGTTANSASTSSVTIAYWSFDSTTTDLYNTYNGTLMSGATYFSSSISQPYVGNGGGLSLSSASSQYFSVTSPFLDLTYKSFTIEAWIYPSISTTSDYGIFGQCQCSSCANQCLYITIRSYKLYISFMNNDLSGNTTLSTSTWYHIAFVYNYDTKQQILYVNGYQDAVKSSASAYQGTTGSIWIGVSQVFLTMSYYNGYIDNFKISTTAKSATDILNAASLTAYYSFDASSVAYDSGPLGVNGTAVNTALVSGRVNEAMRFSGSSSYFYAYGFYQIGFGYLAGKSFSVSLWINPSLTTSCAIVQTAYSLSNSACHNLLGFYSTLAINAQIIVQGWSWPVIYGPFATLYTWTHISVTYSSTNGLRLYVNGVYYGNTGSFTFSNSGYIAYLVLGYAYSCTSNSISNAGYRGSIDEVYVHSREITQSEVTTFANP